MEKGLFTDDYQKKFDQIYSNFLANRILFVDFCKVEDEGYMFYGIETKCATEKQNVSVLCKTSFHVLELREGFRVRNVDMFDKKECLPFVHFYNQWEAAFIDFANTDVLLISSCEAFHKDFFETFIPTITTKYPKLQICCVSVNLDKRKKEIIESYEFAHLFLEIEK